MRTGALKVVRKTTVHPQAVLTVGGASVAFALKGETELTLLFPRESQIAADTSTQDPEVGQGTDAVRLWFGGGNVRSPDENLNGQIGAGTLTPVADGTLNP